MPLNAFGHEQVALCHDEATGLRAIIAIYSTALGPALGGTRFYPYPSDEAALDDALELSRAMAYKNALAGLDHGGGKAVIIGEPSQLKTPALLRAYGRFVQSLNGRYVTACDVGTYVADMDIVATECEFVTGRSESAGGAGDSSVLTAFGVFQGMRAGAQHLWGSPSLAGRQVGIAGVGKVGHLLADLAVADGAKVVVTDVNDDAVRRVLAAHPEVDVAESTDELLGRRLDVYAPCALGHALTDDVVDRLDPPGPADPADLAMICGGANNQLAHPGIAERLAERNVLYLPDFMVNAGGVIQVADERHGFDFERARERTARIFQTTLEVLSEAATEQVPPSVAADRLAERRMATEGTPDRIWLASAPGRPSRPTDGASPPRVRPHDHSR
ncbi:MAG: valine dehydrogenase [Actinomycetota bacterium]|nr:valine dehydrogenase [Actinomycetota bacterium]